MFLFWKKIPVEEYYANLHNSCPRRKSRLIVQEARNRSRHCHTLQRQTLGRLCYMPRPKRISHNLLDHPFSTFWLVTLKLALREHPWVSWRRWWSWWSCTWRRLGRSSFVEWRYDFDLKNLKYCEVCWIQWLISNAMKMKTGWEWYLCLRYERKFFNFLLEVMTGSTRTQPRGKSEWPQFDTNSPSFAFRSTPDEEEFLAHQPKLQLYPGQTAAKGLPANQYRFRGPRMLVSLLASAVPALAGMKCWVLPVYMFTSY